MKKGSEGFFPTSDEIWKAIHYIGKNEIAMFILLELGKNSCTFYEMQKHTNMAIDQYLQGLMDYGLVAVRSSWKEDKYSLTILGKVMLEAFDKLIKIREDGISLEDMKKMAKDGSLSELLAKYDKKI